MIYIYIFIYIYLWHRELPQSGPHCDGRRRPLQQPMQFFPVWRSSSSTSDANKPEYCIYIYVYTPIGLDISTTSCFVVMVRVVFLWIYYSVHVLCTVCIRRKFSLVCSFWTVLIKDSLYNSPLEKRIYESERKNHPK